jgi:hypothetical protein
MSEATQAAPVAAPASADSTTTTTTVQTPAASPVESTQSAPAAEGLSFIPETYRSAGWATKYKTTEDFFKGVDNMAKVVGQKQVVQGLQVPGENATPEELKSFYSQLGVPESPDKYTLPEDVQLFEGADIATERKAFAEIAHKVNIPPKQAGELFKAYAERMNKFFGESQSKVQAKFDEVLVSTFGKEFQGSLDLAKRGAKSLPDGASINLEDLTNPVALRALAKLGEYVGEDALIEGGTAENAESILAEARRIQASDEYIKGDKTLHAKVAGMYKKVYG